MGAVVLADTRRLEDCFPAVDFFESRGIEFVIAVNEFDDALRYQTDDVRSALDLKPDIPVIFCDARDRRSSTGVLINLIQHLLQTRTRP
jgi:signal recognition particle receptor subunit beta